MKCDICEREYYYRKNIEGECPYCNRDTYNKIQHDINFLYRIYGYRSTLSTYPRMNRLWKRQYLSKTNLRYSI